MANKSLDGYENAEPIHTEVGRMTDEELEKMGFYHIKFIGEEGKDYREAVETRIKTYRLRAGVEGAKSILELDSIFYLTLHDKYPDEAGVALHEAIRNLKTFLGEK